MTLPRSKYPFEQLHTVGMTLTARFSAETNIISLGNSIRVCGLKWARRAGLPWKFRIELNKPDDHGMPGVTIIRLEDTAEPAPVGKTTNYAPTEFDQRGDTHRKYDFGKLDKPGKHLIIPMTAPAFKRVSAHQAGKIWAKKRELDWKFRVSVTSDNMHLRIERIK